MREEVLVLVRPFYLGVGHLNEVGVRVVVRLRDARDSVFGVYHMFEGVDLLLEVGVGLEDGVFDPNEESLLIQISASLVMQNLEIHQLRGDFNLLLDGEFLSESLFLFLFDNFSLCLTLFIELLPNFLFSFFVLDIHIYA